MSLDPGEIVIGANGSILVAPVGIAIPASINVAPGAGWVDLGYASEDGATITAGKSTGAIRGWQSLYDLRRYVESRSLRVGFTLQQFNRVNFGLAMGGGEVAEVGDGTGFFRYTPPDPGDLDERALMINWVDGANRYRLTIARTMVSDDVEMTVNKTANVGLPLAFDLLGEEGVDPWILDTDDPSFEPAA